MAEIAPSAEALAFEIQQGVGSGNWGRAAISDAIKLYAAAAVAAERDQCVQEWIALNKCLGFLARCEGDEAARAWNSFAGLMDEWAAGHSVRSPAMTARLTEDDLAAIERYTAGDGVLAKRTARLLLVEARVLRAERAALQHRLDAAMKVLRMIELKPDYMLGGQDGRVILRVPIEFFAERTALDETPCAPADDNQGEPR